MKVTGDPSDQTKRASRAMSFNPSQIRPDEYKLWTYVCSSWFAIETKSPPSFRHCCRALLHESGVEKYL